VPTAMELMKIQNFFGRCYIINLPDRKDRRKEMLKELEKSKLPLSPGKVEFFPAIQPRDPGGFPSAGVKGCFLSHLAILKQARKDSLSNVLIMEDDLTIFNLFTDCQGSFLRQLQQSDWGFVYFGHVIPESHLPKQNGENLLPFSGPISTTHFYCVHAKIYNRLIPFLEKLQARPKGHPAGGPMHVDGAYSTFRSQNPDIMTLVAFPKLGEQRSSRSDISPKWWFDHLPVIRKVSDWARTTKRFLVARQKM
jgi:glycosyl transferase, family 25